MAIKLNMTNNKLPKDVKVEEGVKVEDAKVKDPLDPNKPKLGDSSNPIYRTRGPQVPQSTTGGCSGKAVKNPSRFPAGFEGIKTDCDEDVRSASPTPDWEDKRVMVKGSPTGEEVQDCGAD